MLYTCMLSLDDNASLQDLIIHDLSMQLLKNKNVQFSFVHLTPF